MTVDKYFKSNSWRLDLHEGPRTNFCNNLSTEALF